MILLSHALNRLASQVAVKITIDGLRLHLVIDADISSHRLLIVLELRLDLLRCQHRGSFADLLVLFRAVFAIFELILDKERFLLLQVEVLHRLIILADSNLARFALARILLHCGALRLRISLHGGCAAVLDRLGNLMVRLQDFYLVFVIL